MRPDLTRREALTRLAAAAAMAALPSTLKARADTGVFAAARKTVDGRFSAALFGFGSGDLSAIELPARGHDIAVRPGTRECVAFARRPGRFAVAFGPGIGSIPFEAGDGRHFFGHGAYSPDGRLLYSTENDFTAGRGVIGVRDASAAYRQIGEFDAHGEEPHDIALLPDGRTLVVANGGILTTPDTAGRELNLATMKPSLAYLDLRTGDLVEEHRLETALHQLSIRHLTLTSRDGVAFGCQYRGPTDEQPPLVGFHRRGERPELIAAPDDTQSAMRNYVGSISADAGGGIVAASAPKGGLITYFDVDSRRFLGASELADGCGVTGTRHRGGFLLTSGEGWLAESEAPFASAPERSRTNFAWDNHAVLVG